MGKDKFCFEQVSSLKDNFETELYSYSNEKHFLTGIMQCCSQLKCTQGCTAPAHRLEVGNFFLRAGNFSNFQVWLAGKNFEWCYSDSVASACKFIFAYQSVNRLFNSLYKMWNWYSVYNLLNFFTQFLQKQTIVQTADCTSLELVYLINYVLQIGHT